MSEHLTPTAPGAIREADAASRRRILFVDDDHAMLEGLRDALRGQRRSWRMTFVSSGEEALRALVAEPPHVVVSDLRMPSMDGAMLMEQVRDRCPDAARIVLSGHAEPRQLARAAAVAHEMIAKPCDSRRLREMIECYCPADQASAPGSAGTSTA